MGVRYVDLSEAEQDRLLRSFNRTIAVTPPTTPARDRAIKEHLGEWLVAYARASDAR